MHTLFDRCTNFIPGHILIYTLRSGGMTFYPVSVKMAHVRVGYLLFAVGAVLAQDTTINRNKQLDPKYRPYWPCKSNYNRNNLNHIMKRVIRIFFDLRNKQNFNAKFMKKHIYF